MAESKKAVKEVDPKRSEAAKKAAATKAAKKAEEERLEAERIAAEKAAAEELARKRSEAAKKAAATKAAKKAEEERLEAERIAAEQAEAARLAAIKGYMIVKPTKDDRFVYVVVAGNKEVIAKGAQTYASVATCKSAIKSVAAIAKSIPVEDQTLVKAKEEKFPKFEIYKDKGEKFRFRLFANNGQQLLACTQGYTTKENCKKGLASVIANCEGRIEVSKERDEE